jgi:hypothetical protein
MVLGLALLHLFVAATVSPVPSGAGKGGGHLAPYSASPGAALHYFEGSWRCTQTMAQPDDAAARAPANSFRFSVKPGVAAQWVEVDDRNVTARKKAFWGYDPGSSQFMALQVNAHGEGATLTSAGWVADTWTWAGKVAQADGQKIWLRQVLTRLGAQQFQHIVEHNTGNQWHRQGSVALCKKIGS